MLDGDAAGRDQASRSSARCFPTLVGNGLYGYEASGYWLDIGTPERYLQATYDILEGQGQDRGRPAARRDGGMLRSVDGADGRGQRHRARRWSAPAASVAAGAMVGGAHRARRGRDGSRRAPTSSPRCCWTGCSVGRGHAISAAIVGPGVTIGEHCRIEGGVVLGEGVTIGPENMLRPARVSSRAWSCPKERSAF